MATSAAHQIGEIIGDFFEVAIARYLAPLINSMDNYYLDYKHPRLARNNEALVKAVDSDGNEHRLDIVVEEGGSEDTFGKPKAYIEVAWRRYKKHSKAKVQEIQGAIMPLVQTNAIEIPFYAAVLSGEFTSNAIDQLKSLGFFVLYFTYEDIVSLFMSENISIRWEEDTPNEKLQEIADRLVGMDKKTVNRLINKFIHDHTDKLQRLTTELMDALAIEITEVRVTPIHGKTKTLSTVKNAINFIVNYNEDSVQPLMRYEISVRYSNEQEYTMRCITKRQAIQFLNKYIDE